MSILINKDTKVICQGFTGQTRYVPFASKPWTTAPIGRRRYSGRGGDNHLGLPVFNTCKEAVNTPHGVPASVIYVPPFYAADAILEAVECRHQAASFALPKAFRCCKCCG